MYLSSASLEISIKILRQIGPDSGKKRQERVSALSRFLATAALLHQEETISISLAEGSQFRQDFITEVGFVLALRNGPTYTTNFNNKKIKEDYAVTNNFLTTALSNTRGRDAAPYPRRPSPLIIMDNESVSIHPEYKNNLINFYELEKIKIGLALWLARNLDLPKDEELLIKFINDAHKSKYGEIANLFTLDSVSLKSITSQLFANGEDLLTPTLPDIDILFTEQDTSIEVIHDNESEDANEVHKIRGSNLIIYGAPGTGKSHRINDGINFNQAIRTVFHPDLQNSDFFGCLKPSSKNGATVYSFAPGPFSRAVSSALANPDQHWILIIEEINRAPAAAVFGELFQLLDRDESGRSSYEIDFPSEESFEWFKDQGHDISRLYIPANLSIRATMNSADQGVYPIDTAFRRRWDQDYMPLDYSTGPVEKLQICFKDGEIRNISWRIFINLLNVRLTTKLRVPEDRLIGPWFVKSHELCGTIPKKVLLYLWDDLLRHEGKEIIFDTENLFIFGDISQALENKKPIFCNDFLNELKATSIDSIFES